MRFQAYGWHVQRVEDGNDIDAMDRAFDAAKADERPSLIIARTHIGYGSPNKQDTAAAHGAPLGEEEITLTKENLGWEHDEPFVIPEEALNEWRRCRQRGEQLQAAWQVSWDVYAAEFPELAKEHARRMSGDLPSGWQNALPHLNGEAAIATRAASGRILNAIAKALPELVGGSADLSGSNNTMIKGEPHMSRQDLAGRNILFGVREHGMGSIMNGMALHGGFRPYGGTFLVFSDYMRPPIRMAALMGLATIYVFTHDSIGLGEDGPTHQPVEMLPALRAIPNLVVIRPADATETVEAWRAAVERREGPVALSLTRQKVPTLDRSSLGAAADLARGAYVLSDSDGPPQAIVLASGSEVAIALEAQAKLQSAGISARVVSMPCMEFFEAQPQSYRDQVLPPETTARVAIEAAQPMAWYRWVGNRGSVVGLDRFGASAPAGRLYEEFGITAEAVVSRVREMM
jgi:transketolase